VVRKRGKAIEWSRFDKATLAQLGTRVRELREARGWSQNDLGEAASVDRSHVSDIERGLANPTVHVLIRLARALGSELVFRD